MLINSVKSHRSVIDSVSYKTNMKHTDDAWTGIIWFLILLINKSQTKLKLQKDDSMITNVLNTLSCIFKWASVILAAKMNQTFGFWLSWYNFNDHNLFTLQPGRGRCEVYTQSTSNGKYLLNNTTMEKYSIKS